jgi:hypothetical protein
VAAAAFLWAVGVSKQKSNELFQVWGSVLLNLRNGKEDTTREAH